MSEMVNMYLYIYMCVYGEMLVLHKIGWNSQEESVKTIICISKSENG